MLAITLAGHNKRHFFLKIKEIPFWSKTTLCCAHCAHTAPAAEESIKRETSISFYHRHAHHYVLYCWGDERGEEQRRLTLGLPEPIWLAGLIRPQLRQAEAWINALSDYCVWGLFQLFFYCYCCLFCFLWEPKASANIHNEFNNKWYIHNVSLMIEIDGDTFDAINSAFCCRQFVFWVKNKIPLYGIWCNK